MREDVVVLVGLMGSGKTTVGEALARRLDWPFVDADTIFEERVGSTIPEFFASRGEAHFRILEREVLAELVSAAGPRVVATGGGVVGDPANRERLRGVQVVWLSIDPARAATRVGSGSGRPMLAGDPVERLVALAAQRDPLYREVADLVVDADGAPEQLAERIAVHLRSGRPAPLTRVAVPLRERAYEVVVGPGAVGCLAEMLPPSVRRAAIVSQAGIPARGIDPGREHRLFEIGDGEPAKSLRTVEELCRSWARWGLTRSDLVVAVGGGVVTDVGGFAASVYHRGLPVVHVSTTLLGQVDAAIGGKTGVNLEEGKNLVGAFWQPAGVICDTDHLATLPSREFRCGLGELAKYHFLGGDDLDALSLPARVAAAVAIKARVVAEDEREAPGAAGGRAVLNYGHTLAHALETSGRYDLRHGEAVAIGLIFAAELAYRLGRIDAARVLEHRQVVAEYGLPHRLPAGADVDELVGLMGRDKKALAGLTFVLDGPDGICSVTGIDRGDLDAAFEAVGWEDAP